MKSSTALRKVGASSKHVSVLATQGCWSICTLYLLYWVNALGVCSFPSCFFPLIGWVRGGLMSQPLPICSRYETGNLGLNLEHRNAVCSLSYMLFIQHIQWPHVLGRDTVHFDQLGLSKWFKMTRFGRMLQVCEVTFRCLHFILGAICCPSLMEIPSLYYHLWMSKHIQVWTHFSSSG